jgi:hypothetical protein
MNRDLNEEHPLRTYFAVEIHNALLHVGLDERDVEAYLSHLLVDFLHRDDIYALRDAAGHRLDAVVDMIAEGDIRLNANSFARERQVHKHIGDFLLFWSGVFPEFLRVLKRPGGKDSVVDVVRQGQMSYYVASTFEHDPFGVEAPVLRKLSEDFLGYQRGLSLVRASFEGFRRQGWGDGFSA